MRLSIGLIVFMTICMAGFPAVAQRVQNGVPFLHPGAKNVRSGEMVVNPAAVSALEQTTDSVSITGVPLVTGASADFILRPAQVFSDDAQFVEIGSGGTTRSLSVAPKQGWIGTDPRQPNRAMFISSNSNSQLHAIVIGDAQTSVTVIKPADVNGVYNIAPNNLPKIPFCGELPPQPESSAGASSSRGPRDIRSTTLYDIDLSLDIAYDLYNELDQSGELAVDYLVDLIGAMNIIYHRDLQANWRVNTVHFWTNPDPFSNSHPQDSDPALTTRDQLYNYRDFVAANRGADNYDLTHLLDAKANLGGLAYVDVLQGNDGIPRQQRSGVSNVYGTDNFPADINTYYWDTYVISHELGHNVGSPHTQCYVPPIDCCAVDQGCSGCASEAAQVGTIMSYCHLKTGQGGGIEMKFHSRCISLMRPLIESSALVSVHTLAPEMQVFGADDTFVNSGSAAGVGTTLYARTVGGALTVQTFTITNPGQQNLVLTGSPAVSVSGNPQFSISAQPGTTVLTPGASTTFAVSYNPTTANPVTAQVSIPTNVPSTPVYTFQVAGYLLEPGPPAVFTFNGNTPIAEKTGYYTPILITVSDVWGRITDVDVKFNGDNCTDPTQTGLQHANVGDLIMMLQSPASTQVELMVMPGAGGPGTGDNFCNTVLDDDTPNSNIQTITAAGAPYTGSYKPMDPLSAFDGEEPNGTWVLFVYDNVAGNTGSVRSASLIISGEQRSASVADWTLYN